ncbi:flagellar biosynthesis anti-sigma factor FlgM [Anaerobacillus sp. CMMVII]|uniref:flagellar biosynthesis anti-sigma factor FlgM n=1 Tax=Anaerobacillus sp. CMMVII TaxID=2755588 RepID=UPI0021B7983A|nr:flagellar biosynthesis anti-sigma factor FlgM [Anaerobacillus sp. CMMVII]MCT8140144.1 flagellar biosynthesis anti-sigma factor FlgM [Anaerobacillus sp. CMMVII]
MKINPYGNLQNIYRKQLDKLQPKGEVTKKRDQLEISPQAKLLQQETRITTERKEKIEQLKAQVQSGEYKVNSQEVAKKFYEFWNE